MDASGGSRANTETGSVIVALGSPGQEETLDDVTAARRTVLLDGRQDGVDVALLVLALVVLGVGVVSEFTGLTRHTVRLATLVKIPKTCLVEPAVL